MPNEQDLAQFGRARAEALGAEARRRTVEASLAATENELETLTAAGGGGERAAALASRLERLTAERAEAAGRLVAARGRAAELRDRSAAQEGPETAIGTLDGQVPIALLPVRLETRFADGGNSLHIRLFPDQVHVDAHEPELTDEEVARGRTYWTRRWAAPTDAAESSAAWASLASGMRATRARWVAEATRPMNALGASPGPAHPEPPRRASTWTRPGRAAALPSRWVAIGRRGGTELFRVWSGAVADDLEVTPSPDDDGQPADGTLLGEGLRWLTDPEAARQKGVLLTVRASDLTGGATLADGIDQLVVLGVDWTRSPDAGADELGGLIEAHVYADGLAFLPQGTPTNNTAETPSGHSSDRAALLEPLDPAREAAGDPVWSAGPRLAMALGLGDGAAVLDHAPGTALAEHQVASALLDATWEATGGTYLGQMLRPVRRMRSFLSDQDIDDLRVWAAANVYPSGPLPAIRIGRQPYGLIPVVDPNRYQPPPGDRAAELVRAATARLRRWWERASFSVPRMAQSGDLDANLVALLQRSPVAATVRFRRAFEQGTILNLVGFETLSQQQELHGWLVASMFEGSLEPSHLRIGSLTTDPRSHALRIPWARPADLAPGAALPYVEDLRVLVGAADGRDRLATRAGATSLAEALLALSAALELDAAHGRVLKGFADRAGQVTVLTEGVRLRQPDAMGVGIEAAPVAGLSFQSPRELSEAVVPGLTGTFTVAEHVRAELDAVLIDGETRPEIDGLKRLIEALDRLRDEPGERVEWSLRGLLDLYSYRLDAWCTGLATQRLAEIRSARPRGLYVGCFGWLENLHPDPPDRDSLGYVHTPSIAHAVAAAVLRSAHVAHRGTAQGALAVDLSSQRVRAAMTVLDGVENGQPLGALLGYRLERSLRERDALLARYVLPLRRLAPLRHTDADLEEPVESIAARDVVDAVALLDRWRAEGGRAAVLDGAEVLPGHRDAVSAVLDSVDDVLDAIADLLLSETVYQTVVGNPERAAAALAALDRQQSPVRPEFPQTPRSGTNVAHRVLVLLHDGDAPGWEALGDPRGAAEPRLNAWLARLLGPADQLSLAGEVRRGDVPRTTVTASAADLGLSPLGIVLAARRSAADRPSELESRIARAMAARVVEAVEDDRLVLLEDPPAGSPPGQWGLAALRTVARWVDQLTSRRSATARDVGPLLDDQPHGLDVAELAARADAASIALDGVIAGLQAAGAAALETAAALGIPDSLPDDTAAGDQVERVLAAARSRQTQLAEATAAFAARTRVTEEQAIEHHRQRLRTVFGEGFPVLPLFRATTAAAIAASAAERAALTDGEDLAPLAWLHRVAHVRPAVDPLASLLTVAEANDRAVGLPHLDVVQLPHQPGQRWVALPPPAGEAVPTGAVGVVIHAPTGFDPSAAAAGFVVDEWTEAIPSTVETTALSFHYDAPAARPPQAIVLAVPAARESARWSFDELLGTVDEAMALSRMRAVGPAEIPDLGGYLPALYVPQDVTGDVPGFDPFELAERVRFVSVLPGVLGKD